MKEATEKANIESIECSMGEEKRVRRRYRREEEEEIFTGSKAAVESNRRGDLV